MFLHCEFAVTAGNIFPPVGCVGIATSIVFPGTALLDQLPVLLQSVVPAKPVQTYVPTANIVAVTELLLAVVQPFNVAST